MPERLFGINLRQTISRALNSANAVYDGTLLVETLGERDPENLTGGLQVVTTEYNFKGLIEKKGMYHQDGQSLLVSHNPTVMIVGDSLPSGIVPKVKDRVRFDELTYNLVELIETDPVQAVFRFEAQL